MKVYTLVHILYDKLAMHIFLLLFDFIIFYVLIVFCAVLYMLYCYVLFILYLGYNFHNK